MTNTVEPIGFDVPALDVYPSFTDRYFQAKYLVDADTKVHEDHCVLIHSNRICVVTLAPSHPVVAFQKTISSINFQIGDKTNRLNNIVQGKRKHGAQGLKPEAILCEIQCEDGLKYSVQSCVHGKLIEINENLVKNPQLLVEKPKSDGYIAIILPHLSKNDKFQSNLVLEEEYMKVVAERKVKVENVPHT
ncbi:protein Abitram [Thrips palmi]|uniref:Protein Abitram n=1 Tax=Thrips palmi TaxID=161013 RepID=A0A6P8ZZ04_THRPL|nr:protein Abitram [Thrips palmi]XP_034249981.1 protein Abitram [Thrips palmi]